MKRIRKEESKLSNKGFKSFEEARAYWYQNIKENPIYNEIDFNNKYKLNAVIKKEREAALKARKTSLHGNALSEERSFDQVHLYDKAYEQHHEEIVEIIKKHIPNEKGYHYAELMATRLFYSPLSDFNEFEDKLNEIALPTAIILMDAYANLDKTEEIKEILKDVELNKEYNFVSAYDITHNPEDVKRLAQIIYERNMDHKNYVPGNEIDGDYFERGDEPRWQLYLKCLNLIPGGLIGEAIDVLIEDLVDEAKALFEVSLIGVKEIVLYLTSIKAKTNDLIDKIKDFKTPVKETDKPIKLSPLININKILEQSSVSTNPLNINSGPLNDALTCFTGINLLNKFTDNILEIHDVENSLYDIIQKYYFIQLSNIGDNFIDGYYSEEVNSRLNVENKYFIDNPYRSIAGAVFAIDRKEIILYTQFMFSSFLNYAVISLPWMYRSNKELNSQIKKLKDVGCDDLLALTDDNYKLDIVPSDNKELVFNASQLVYMLTGGTIMPRSNVENAFQQNVLDYLFEGQDEIKSEMLVASALMQNVKKAKIFQAKNTYKFIKEEVEKQTKDINNKSYQEAVGKMKSNIEELQNSERRLFEENKILKEEKEKIEKNYQDDLKELAELRELMFNQQIQIDENKETSNIELPFKTSKRIVVFGGHDNWISKMKENIDGEIKFIPNNTAIKNEMLAKADLAVIQTSYIPHGTYYGAINVIKKMNIPFKCIYNSSPVKCTEIIKNELAKL